MDIQNIMELWDRFESSAASEMELEFQGTHFSLKKAAADPAAGGRNAEERRKPSENKAEGSRDAVMDRGRAVGQEQLPLEVSRKEIRAPLVGTFYRAASPEEEPFVTVGQQVSKGDVVGIIEAMKLMNEVTAPVDGIVEEILAEDETLVAYHQTLIRMR